MRYLFGPVPSRRLGQSLGIDPIPLKTCNWNCVYCQLGRSVPMTNERRAYYPREAILEEVRATLANPELAAIDWITFVGSGEPTLHSDLGWLIRQVKALTAIPVAVCTNGALLYQAEVREALLAADAVMPTVSAGTPELHWHIHRPYPGLTFERHLEGLLAFRQAYGGKLWPEVMLLRGLNDNEPALQAIAAVLERIQPDWIHLALPTRPPAETWVQPADEAGVKRARAILGMRLQARLSVLWPTGAAPDLSGHDDVADAILDIIARHPVSQADLLRALAGMAPEALEACLEQLRASGRAQVVARHGTLFWSAGPAAYPSERQSEAVSPQRLRGRLRYHRLPDREQ